MANGQTPSFKTAGQSIDDVCLGILRDFGNDLRTQKLKQRFNQQAADRLSGQIQTLYNGLNAVKYQNTPQRADKFKAAFDFIKRNIEGSDPNYTVRVNDLRGLMQFQPTSGVEKASPVVDERDPNYLKYPGINFLASPYGKTIVNQMGQWVKQESNQTTGNEETLILAKKEPWDMFRQMSGYVLHNNENVPTSEQLGLEPIDEMNQQNKLDMTPLPISITPLNTPEGSKYWNVHKNKDNGLPKGIRIQFDAKDNNFWKVRDHVAKGDEAFKDARIGTSIVDIYDLDPYKLQKLSKQLSTWGYGKFVEPLNILMQQFTGKSYGEIAEEQAKDVKGQPLSPAAINNGMDRNTGRDKTSKLITANIPFDDAFQAEMTQKYPAVFNPEALQKYLKMTPEAARHMVREQQRGVHFMLTRQSSVEADSPGAGKTPQTITFADMAVNKWSQATNGQHQKVLVFTPGQLIDEHWVTDTSNPDPQKHKMSKPIQYIGDSEKSVGPNGQVEDKVAIIRNFEDLQKSMQTGAWATKKWIVVPYSALGMTADANSLAQALAKEVKNKTFAASMADEIQMQKDFAANVDDASATLKNMDIIFSGAMAKGGELNLPHRVAMSGTPADNSPADMFSIMRATRHPVIYADYTTQQYQDGFVKQTMGMDESQLSKYKETDNNPERGDHALNDFVKWAMTTTPQGRDANLRMFGETFIRRTKEQLRPDMPKKAPREQSHIDTGQQWPEVKGPGAKQQQDRQMAIAKIPHTVAAAVQFLKAQGNENKKVFITSYYPKVVKQIAEGINAQLGDGTAASVSGSGVDGAGATGGRGDIADAFQRNQQLVQGVPFRAACYTLGVGAVGLNFKVASRVIFNDIDWNPSKNLQAEDRIWRIDMPADQVAERQYMIIPNSRDAQKFQRVMQKENVNERFHKVLQDISDSNSSNPAISQKLADNFTLEVIDELMFNFNRGTTQGMADPTTGQMQQVTLEQLIGESKQKLLAHFAQQRQAGTKQRKKAPAMPVAASNVGWYKRMKIASLF